MMLNLLIAACAVAALAPLLAKREGILRWIAGIGSTVVLLLAFVVTVPVLFGSVASLTVGNWYLDPFAALLVLLVGFVQWTATLMSLPYLHEEMHEGIVTFPQARLYYTLLGLFVLSMLLTLLTNSLGLMWVALEGSTLATTMLVAFYTHEGSLEAAWKYIVLCSVGISLGLLGVMLVFYAAAQAGLVDPSSLSWTALHAAASRLSPSIMRWAFVFIFIGYGTKVGLVPMHAWLPDAHGRTPSPVSAMLSGVLLNIALFAMLRYKSLVDLALGDSAWSNRLFLVFGAMSFILPAAFVVVQRNYKRLLAYSSIEHMGFATFAIGLGPVGSIAAIIHLIGHSLTKSMLFFGTGNILLRFKTTKIDRVSQVMKYLPYTGTFFLIGLLLLLATPPSPLFFSEYLGFSSAMVSHPYLSLVMLFAGTVIFAGMIRQVVTMLYTERPKAEPHDKTPERWGLSHSVMMLHMIAILIFGISLFQPGTQALIARIADSLR